MTLLCPIPHSHCHYCGFSLHTSESIDGGWQCKQCSNINWQNPIPVAILIVPCGNHESGREHGVFTVRRGIPPFEGQLALPGGFMIHNEQVQETWQRAACRETAEEINVICRHDSPFEGPQHLLTESSYNERRVGDRILIIGASGGAFAINEFVPSKEAQERVILFPDDKDQLCFPIHRKALAMYWDKLNVAHNVKV